MFRFCSSSEAASSSQGEFSNNMFFKSSFFDNALCKSSASGYAFHISTALLNAPLLCKRYPPMRLAYKAAASDMALLLSFTSSTAHNDWTAYHTGLAAVSSTRLWCVASASFPLNNDDISITAGSSPLITSVLVSTTTILSDNTGIYRCSPSEKFLPEATIRQATSSASGASNSKRTVAVLFSFTENGSFLLNNSFSETGSKSCNVI